MERQFSLITHHEQSRSPKASTRKKLFPSFETRIRKFLQTSLRKTKQNKQHATQFSVSGIRNSEYHHNEQKLKKERMNENKKKKIKKN